MAIAASSSDGGNSLLKQILDATKDSNNQLKSLVRTVTDTTKGAMGSAPGPIGTAAVAGVVGAAASNAVREKVVTPSRDSKADYQAIYNDLKARGDLGENATPSNPYSASGKPIGTSTVTSRKTGKVATPVEDTPSPKVESVTPLAKPSNSVETGFAAGAGFNATRAIGAGFLAAKGALAFLAPGDSRAGMTSMQAYNAMQTDAGDKHASLAAIAARTDLANSGGAMGGALGGALAGGIAGSIIPGVGTVIGAGVGLVAGAAGGYLGEKIGNDISGVGKGGR